MSVPEKVQQVHIVTEVNSSLDVPINIEKQEDNSIKNDEIDEVDELIEWTQCLPTTDEIIEEDLSIL
ncbi:unnamed protein product [Adineta steineri]|nr:unnamed protein product [Adineta steineri]